MVGDMGMAEVGQQGRNVRISRAQKRGKGVKRELGMRDQSAEYLRMRYKR
jgi:hypothetical protein